MSEIIIQEIYPDVFIVRNYLTIDICNEFIELADKETWYIENIDEYSAPEKELGNVLTRKLFDAYVHHLYNVLNDFLNNQYMGKLTLMTESLRMFIVKYTLEMQTDIGIHYDETSKITMCVKLNDDFEGGHTYLPRQDILIDDLKVGDAVIFPGGSPTHIHEAQPITKGTRYNLAHWIN